jgi:hypothetical protein
VGRGFARRWEKIIRCRVEEEKAKEESAGESEEVDIFQEVIYLIAGIE